jgi:hypothetical protein
MLMRSSDVRRAAVPRDKVPTPMGINLGVGAAAVVAAAVLVAFVPPRTCGGGWA